MVKVPRMAVVAALLLACGLMITPAMAGENPAPRRFPSSCLQAAGEVSPQPAWRTTDVCNMTLCPNDDYCWSVCSSASTAACINNVCYYTFPGGGSSGGGNDCPNQRLCRDDSYCVYDKAVPDPPLYGTCVNGLCVC